MTTGCFVMGFREDINRLVAILGEPADFGENSVCWDIRGLHVEADTSAGGLAISLPWPLRTISEPPGFGEVRRGEQAAELRLVPRNRADLDSLLDLIAVESRPAPGAP